MERLATARCDDCGYVENEIVIGGCVAVGSGGERWPCLCFSCRRVVSAAINREPLACGCGSTNVELHGCIAPQSASRQLLRSEERAIEDVSYACPRCGTIALRFAPGVVLSD
jgi:hypothetical protein